MKNWINTKIRSWLDRFCANCPTRRIDSDGKDYLFRVYLWHIGGFRFYLHKFVGGDGDRWIHDHPFNALSIILVGSYQEEHLAAFSHPELITKSSRRRFINFVPAGKFHRIGDIEKPTWTLFIHAPHHKSWGFLCPIGDAEGLPPAAHIYHNPYKKDDSYGRHWWIDAKTLAEFGGTDF